MVAPASSDSILIMLNSLISPRLESVGAPEKTRTSTTFVTRT